MVYSTCTLAMPQNDGTVQATIEKLWHTTDIDVVVEDTSNIVDGFREIFELLSRLSFWSVGAAQSNCKLWTNVFL